MNVLPHVHYIRFLEGGDTSNIACICYAQCIFSFFLLISIYWTNNGCGELFGWKFSFFQILFQVDVTMRSDNNGNKAFNTFKVYIWYNLLVSKGCVLYHAKTTRVDHSKAFLCTTCGWGFFGFVLGLFTFKGWIKASI